MFKITRYLQHRFLFLPFLLLLRVILNLFLIMMEKYPQARNVFNSIRGMENAIHDAKLSG